MREKTMKHIDLWKTKLKAAKSVHRIRERELNAARRAHASITLTIDGLEKRIENYMAKAKRKLEDARRIESLRDARARASE
jgi:hypothetical protein